MRPALQNPRLQNVTQALCKGYRQFPSHPAKPTASQRGFQTHRPLSARAKFPAPRRASPRFRSIAAPAALHIIAVGPSSRIAESQPRPHGRHIRAGVDLFTLSAVAVLLFVSYGLSNHWSQPVEDLEEAPDAVAVLHALEEMAASPLPGRPGNLTPEQEAKLRLLWSKVLSICGVGDPNEADHSIGHASSSNGGSAQPNEPESGLKKRMTFWSKKSKTEEAAPADGAAALDEKYGQTQEYFDAIATLKPEEIRRTIWNMIKFDDPDGVMLRFLRARKWDVDRALVMMVSTMKWRITDMQVDDDIMVNGEEHAAAEAEKDPKGLMRDFIMHCRTGKTYLHGVDKGGHPLAVTRVRLHKPGEFSAEALERFTIYILEQGRMTVRQPVDTATLIFDLTGFSMANMDYAPLKFIIKALEANYPECLESILVHKAPWVFQGIWKVIKGWLDPVVASKIHFTNNVTDLQEFIELNKIPKELEGGEDWEYKYIEPVAGENERLKDTATRDKLLAKHDGLIRQYEAATRRWISAKGVESEDGKAAMAERSQIRTKLTASYWEHDPYTRARSLLDREGVIKENGTIDFYPTNGAPAPAAASSAPAATTSADDVD